MSSDVYSSLDSDTGRHVIRVGLYAGIIADQLGLERHTVQLIQHAAPLHDMGKIGIPDAILLKPGKLDPDEIKLMQRHCEYGTEILAGAANADFHALTLNRDEIEEQDRSPLLELAATIAISHHERWDGSGYPFGLSGNDIPLEGRITAVADVFDALHSSRPYKEAFPLEKCFQILDDGRGTHFDPTVLDAFFQRRNDIIRVRCEFSDD